MNFNHKWIKMGFNICKILIIFELLMACIRYTNPSNQAHYFENFNFNKSLGVTAKAEKKEEEKPVEKPVVNQTPVVSNSNTSSNFRRGQLTGYGADCPLCNGTLACKPSYNVYKNGVVTYPDATYGDVRIVASSKKLACGSIIAFDLSTISSSRVYAIVLDRGVLGNDIDLLMTSEHEAGVVVGRRNFTYEIIRSGW
jgi:hypothetical protein